MPDAVAYYDLSKNPPSFNFLDFMLEAEKWRIKNEIEKIRFSIIPGPMDGFRRDCLPPSGGAERTKWLNNIVIPMPCLLPSCGIDAVMGAPVEGPKFGIGEYLIGFYALIKSAEQNLYILRAPEDRVAAYKEKYGKYVTVTIRDTGWWVKRTTNISEWVKVANEIKKDYRVVFIPDGTKPETVVEGYDCDVPASQNSVERAALYQGSEMNFGIPCGPMWMCLFLGAPMMMVKMLIEEEPSTRSANYARVGLNPGSQMPNSKPRQRLVWKQESAPIILSEFENLMR